MSVMMVADRFYGPPRRTASRTPRGMTGIKGRPATPWWETGADAPRPSPCGLVRSKASCLPSRRRAHAADLRADPED